MSWGLYIHWPFCRSKCPYCSFASFPDKADRMARYADALCREAEMRREEVFSVDPSTIYIGGGTPSMVPSSLIGRVVEKFGFRRGIEFTVEANPDTVSEPWLDELLAFGANRLSIGIQALDDSLLANLGRLHSSERAIWAVETARKAGFENISVDLMFGVPGQTMVQWTETLERVLSLEITHLSGYSLGIEEDTPYFRLAEAGGLAVPAEDAVSEMYLCMSEMLRSRGFRRYEVSNFALPNRESRHNRRYWNFTPYLGLGASAHSFDGLTRWWNEPDPDKYIEMVRDGKPPTRGAERSDAGIRAQEELMLSLRTAEGIDLDDFFRRNCCNSESMERKLGDFESEKLITRSPGNRIALTDGGFLAADEILSELAAELSSKPLKKRNK